MNCMTSTLCLKSTDFTLLKGQRREDGFLPEGHELLLSQCERELRAAEMELDAVNQQVQKSARLHSEGQTVLTASAVFRNPPAS